jgi:hypothetical protein
VLDDQPVLGDGPSYHTNFHLVQFEL